MESSNSTDASGQDSHTAARDRSVWIDAFDEDTRKQLVADDSIAWRTVTGLLLTIVVIGVIIAVFAVTVCSSTTF